VLPKAFQEVHQGRYNVTLLATQRLVGYLIRVPGPGRGTGQLTMQREVLQLMAEGRTMYEIARIPAITPRTVAYHKYSLMEDLGIKTSAELVQFAIKLHIVTA
jgi:DNA-binding CsgD family transcriptional regulator